MLPSFFFNWLVYLFVSGCTRWSLLPLGYSLVAVRRHPTAGASLAVEQRLGGAWAFAAHGLSTCGAWPLVAQRHWNLPGLGIELCPLHWQVDFYPMYHQGRPRCYLISPHPTTPSFINTLAPKGFPKAWVLLPRSHFFLFIFIIRNAVVPRTILSKAQTKKLCHHAQ